MKYYILILSAILIMYLLYKNQEGMIDPKCDATNIASLRYIDSSGNSKLRCYKENEVAEDFNFLTKCKIGTTKAFAYLNDMGDPLTDKYNNKLIVGPEQYWSDVSCNPHYLTIKT